MKRHIIETGKYYVIKKLKSKINSPFMEKETLELSTKT
jgi:hypothetical protein